MEYGVVKVRCLFCESTVEGDQRLMAGRWDSPRDLVPRWKFDEGQPGKCWLWHGAGSPEVHQDFYLCPRHNDPDHFHSAEKWAWVQLQKGIYVDFTDLVTCPILPEPEEKWGARTSLPDEVPDISEADIQSKLPNSWQYQDPRLEGCLDISYAIVDTWDMDWSPFILDQLELDSFPTPLELAEAMKKAAIRIELLTEKAGGSTPETNASESAD